MRAALLPAKPLALSKTRLSPALSSEDRIALSLAMFEDVLDRLVESASLDLIVVISADVQLLDLAREHRTLPLDELAPRGLDAAVDLGTREVMARGASEVLVVLTDAPFVTSAEIDALGNDLPPGACVRLARSHEGIGTNAILRRPPSIMGTRFGGASLDRHVLAARRAGARCEILDLPGIAFDVDTVENLRQAAGRDGAPRTLAEIRRRGLATAELRAG